MNYSKINCPIIIEKFPFHNQYQNELLDLMSDEPLSRLVNDNDLISLTDWEFHNKRTTKYSKYFLHLARNTINQMILSIHQPSLFEPMKIDNVWCQRYQMNDTHSWHHHGNATMSFVYYLELPKGTPGTELMDPITKEIHQPPVEEGDILMFPGFLFHRSPENQSSEMKSVIAFNAFYG